MFIVNRKDVTVVGLTLITEASSIGLRPGEWPDFVAVVDDEGKGLLFGPSFTIDEMGGREYSSRTSISLVIAND